MYFKLVVLSLVVIDTVLATGSSYRCMMVANTAGLLMGIYGCHESGCTVPKKPSFGDRFDQYDANGDGQLSYAEMSSVANDMVPGPNQLKIHLDNQAMQKIDKTLSGLFWIGHNKLSVLFMGFLFRDGTLTPYDMDHDKNLSRDEIKSYLKHRDHCCFQSRKNGAHCLEEISR